MSIDCRGDIDQFLQIQYLQLSVVLFDNPSLKISKDIFVESFLHFLRWIFDSCLSYLISICQILSINQSLSLVVIIIVISGHGQWSVIHDTPLELPLSFSLPAWLVLLTVIPTVNKQVEPSQVLCWFCDLYYILIDKVSVISYAGITLCCHSTKTSNIRDLPQQYVDVVGCMNKH